MLPGTTYALALSREGRRDCVAKYICVLTMIGEGKRNIATLEQDFGDSIE